MVFSSSSSSTTPIHGFEPKPTTKWIPDIIEIIRRKRNQNINQNGEKLFQRHFIGLRIYVPVYSLSDHGQYWGMLRSVQIRQQEIVRAGVCVCVCVLRRNLLRCFSWFLQKISNIFAKIIILRSDFFSLSLGWFMELFSLYSSSSGAANLFIINNKNSIEWGFLWGHALSLEIPRKSAQ